MNTTTLAGLDDEVGTPAAGGDAPQVVAAPTSPSHDAHGGRALPSWTLTSGAAAAAALLAACGGGEGGADTAPTTPTTPTTPTVPTVPVVPPTRVEAARFLLQAQFSASDAEIAAVQTLGYAAWLEQQFNAPRAISAWDWAVSKGYNSTAVKDDPTPVNYLAWQQLMSSSDAFRMRIVLAMSEIFVVYGEGVSGSGWPVFAMAAYWDMLATNAFGTYRQMLEAVTLNPAVGVFLNTRGNQKADSTGRAPDENYGREVMQLFAIGLYELNADGTVKTAGGKPVETYDQATVTNIASMFTGWDFDTTGSTDTHPAQVRNRMKLTAARHADTAATFLGTTVAAGTDGTTALRMTLDTLANHANVGPFIGKQLIQRLVTSNPSAAYVARVSAAFANNGAGVRGDFKAVLRAVLLDDEARNAANLAAPAWGKVREPIVRLVQWARTFKATSASGDWKLGDTSSTSYGLGQSPLKSPTVFNFFRPGYVPPDTPLVALGYVAPEFQIINESTVAAYLNFMTNTIRTGFFDVKSDYAAELAIAADAAALVDRVNLLLCAGQLSTSTVDTMRTAIATISGATAAGLQNRVYSAVLLAMAAPQYLIQK